MDLCERIKKRRHALGMSQEELATRLGYKNRSAIAKIEKGVNDITQSKIAAFASELETTPAYLMGWTDDYYDYDRDIDNRLDECYGARWEFILEQCDYDVEQAYHRWIKFKEAEAADTLAETQTWKPTITERDQRDVAKEVENILDGLDSRAALSFDGEAIDDTTKELLRKSLENTLETARLIAKEKYTPKKYRK